LDGIPSELMITEQTLREGARRVAMPGQQLTEGDLVAATRPTYQLGVAFSQLTHIS